LHIHSDISSTQGLGSSSAVMAGLLAGFAPLLPEPLSLEARFVIGRDLIRQVQGSGSGTDLASALLGGVIQLTPLRNEITRLADDLPLTSVYVGYKTPTAEVIRRVTDDWQRYPDLYQHQLMSMSQLTHQAQEAIHARDLARLGRLMTMAHGLMHGLGVSDTQLDALVHQLRACDGILGAKISGSGLGDCVIALGKTTQYFAQEVPVTVTPKGAYHD
jgi:mevalonate kinase